MWPSEEWASRLYDWANFGLILGLVIGVVSTVFVVWMGNVKETYLRKALGETNKQSATAEEAASTALLEQEQLHHKNLILEAKLLDLQKETEARRLTGAQKEQLTKLLSKTKGGVAIVSAMADPEASDFADDFNSSLQAANWETLRIPNLISDRFGVAIVTVEGTKRDDLEWLDKGLSAIGIRHDVRTLKTNDPSLGSISPHFEPGFLYLVIGHKPLPHIK